jgi:hypothetical protein
MIKTSTPALDFTANKIKSSTENQIPDFAAPSFRTIEAILNYGKNLEIRKSKLVQEVEFIKS